MAYYKTCPNCGAHLDPQERCDCAEKEESKKESPVMWLALPDDLIHTNLKRAL